MKKILSVLFAVAMVFGCMSGISVSADSGFTLSASNETAFPGGEVRVSVALSDNVVGITGVQFSLGYDANLFVMKEVVNEGLMDGYMNSQTIDVNPYLVLYGQPSDTYETGVLTTFVFEVKETTPAGVYPLDLEVLQCNHDGSKIPNPPSVDGTITVKEPVSTLTSSSISLGQDIAINYYVELCPADVGAQMKFTMNNKETLVDGVKVAGDEYKYTFTKIAPQCMGDTIKAELMKGGNVILTKEEFSVRANCQALVAKDAAALGYTDEQYAAMKTLVADLMEYGAAAQLYKDHATTALVNEGFSGASSFTSFVNEDKYVEEGKNFDENLVATAAGVYFDYENSLYLKYDCVGFTAENSRITFVEVDPANDFEEIGDPVTYTINDSEMLSEGKYCLKIPVAPTEFDSVYLFTLEKKPSTRWQVSQDVYYSVNAYIYSIVTGGTASDGMVSLAKTLYNYGVSAEAFMNSFNG